VAGAADAQVLIEAVLKDSVTGALNDLENNAKTAGENTEGHISNRVGGAVKLLGGLAISAGAALVTMLGDGVAGAMEAEAAMAQLDAVIASTGNAAGVSKDSLKALADQVQLTTKFTAEQVTATQSMLLTFTNIGSKGGVFDQATQAAIDMAAALGGEAKDKALMLGKALNDPVAGISALTRVGVTFSESQKEVIKKLAETGDVAGAQKLILAELTKEFGGSATAAGKTMAGQLAIAKNAFGEVTEEIGVKLLPVLTKILQWVVANMPAIQSGIGKAMDFVSKVFQAAKKDVDTVVAAFNLIVGAVTTVANGISNGTKTVKTVTEKLWATIKGVFINVTKFFSDIGKNIIEGIWSGITNAKKWFEDKLGAFVNALPQFVKDLLGIKSPSTVFAEIGRFMMEGLALGIIQNIGKVLDALGQLARIVKSEAAGILGDVGSGIQTIATSGGDPFKIASGAMQIFAPFAEMAEEILEPLKAAFDKLIPVLEPLAEGLATIVVAVEPVVTAFVDGIAPVAEALGEMLKELAPLVLALMEAIAPVIRFLGQTLGALLRALMPVIRVVVDILTPVFRALGVVLDALIEAIRYVVKIISFGTIDIRPATPKAPEVEEPEVATPDVDTSPPPVPVPEPRGVSLPGIGIQSAVATPIVESARILKDVAGAFQAQVAAFGGHVGNFGGFVAEVRALAADLRANAANGTAGLRYA
jgi:hypothetical protein